MWNAEIVRDRFVEAAATERFLPALRKPDARGFWPEYRYDQDDRDGWDDKARDDHMAIWQGKGTAKADAITRHAECIAWTIENISDPMRRKLVWAFAFCRANKRDFGSLCQKKGWVRSTAYNRLNRTWAQLASDFNNERRLLTESAAQWSGHEEGSGGTETNNMGRIDTSPDAIKFTPSFRTEESRDLIQTQEDADAFAKMLERRNARLRKLNAWRNETKNSPPTGPASGRDAV